MHVWFTRTLSITAQADTQRAYALTHLKALRVQSMLDVENVASSGLIRQLKNPVPRECMCLQGIRHMHPSLQHAALTALNSSLAHASRPAASSALPSAEQLASLLQLLQLPSARPAITTAAYSAAQRFLDQALEFQNMAEVHLWLDCLPRAVAGEYEGRCAVLAAPSDPPLHILSYPIMLSPTAQQAIASNCTAISALRFRSCHSPEY